MVLLTLTLIAVPGAALSMASALRPLIIQARSERACLRCELSANVMEPDILHYVEEWATEDDLRDQIRSDRFRRLIAVMETARERPRISVQVVSQTSGLEYIADALQGTGTL